MITRRYSLMFLVVMLMSIFAFSAQAQGINTEITVTCPEGGTITNGVEITGNVRPGEYRVTLLGINGFDPIGAIADDSGVLGCGDDSADLAPLYQANLPPMGNLASSTLNSALFYRNNSNTFQNFSVVVGGFGGQSGEVLVVLEDLRVSTDDGQGEGAGDPIGVRITQNLLASGQPIIAYMLGVQQSLDPFIAIVGSDDAWLRDSQGTPLVCDDGGDASRCYNTGTSLATSVMVVNDGQTRIVGDSFDAMLQVDPAMFNTASGDMIYFHFTSYNQQSTGDYVAAFRIPIGTSTGVVPQPTIPAQAAGGVSATGSLSVTSPEAFFSFVGVQGETVTVTAQNTTATGGIDTLIELLNEQGIVLTSNDDHGSNDTSLGRFDSRISNFSLPVSGAYFIRVTSFSGRDAGTFQVTVNKTGTPTALVAVTGITSGSLNTQPTPAVIGQATPTFGLLLPTQPQTLPTQAPPVVQPTTAAQPEAISISYGQSVTGELVQNATSQNYVFNASAGDVVTITMRSADPAGTLDSRLFLFDASGSQVADHDDVGAGTPGLSARDARIQGFTIPTAGTYRIQATSFAGASFGRYELTLELGSGTTALPTTAPAATATTGGGGLGTLLNLPTATPVSAAPAFELPPLTNTLSFSEYSLQAPADWTAIETDNFDVVGNDPDILQTAVTGGEIDAMPQGSIVVAILKPNFLQNVGLATAGTTPTQLLDNLFSNSGNTLLSPVADYSAALGPTAAIARNIEGAFPANTVVVASSIDGDLYGFIVFSSFSYDVIEPLIVSVIGTLNPIGAPLPAPTVAATATAGSLSPAPTPAGGVSLPGEASQVSVEGGTFSVNLPTGWQIDVNAGDRVVMADNPNDLSLVMSGDFEISSGGLAFEIAPPDLLAELASVDGSLGLVAFGDALAERLGGGAQSEIVTRPNRDIAIVSGDEDSTISARILIETQAGVIGVLVLSDQPFSTTSSVVLPIVDTMDYTRAANAVPTEAPATAGTETLTVDLGSSGQLSLTAPEGWFAEDQGNGSVALGSSVAAAEAARSSDPSTEVAAGEIAIQLALPVEDMLGNFGVTDPFLNPDSMLSAILAAADGTGKIEVLQGLSHPAVIVVAEVESLSQPTILISVQYPTGTITYAVFSDQSFADIADILLPVLDSVDYQPA